MADFFDIATLAAIYAVYASGFTLVFGLFDVLNLAHATVFGFVAVFVLYLASVQHLSFWVVVLIAVVGGGVLGLLVERIAFRTIRYRAGSTWSKHLGPMITSLGAASVLGGVSSLWFGITPLSFPHEQLSHTFIVGDARITVAEIVTIVMMVLVFGLLMLLLRRTRWGLEIRGVADRPATVGLLGVNVERRTMQVFSLAGMLGGLAAVLWAVQFNTASQDTSSQVDIRGFAIIVLGGMGSVPGAAVGAVFLAAVEVLSVRWLPNGWQSMIAYIALFLVLIVRPQGLLGRELETDRP